VRRGKRGAAVGQNDLSSHPFMGKHQGREICDYPVSTAGVGLVPIKACHCLANKLMPSCIHR